MRAGIRFARAERNAEYSATPGDSAGAAESDAARTGVLKAADARQLDSVAVGFFGMAIQRTMAASKRSDRRCRSHPPPPDAGQIRVGLAPLHKALTEVERPDVAIGWPYAGTGRPRSWNSFVRPWAPDGDEALSGTAICACDACGSTSALLAAAASRIAWSRPLSAASDHPPATSPYS